MKNLLSPLLITLILTALSACGGGSGSNSPGGSSGNNHQASEATNQAGSIASTPPNASEVVKEYCAEPGQASAQVITSPYFKLEGPNAIASQGDFVLANDKAMYAISGLGEQKTYYHYPGILIDAVAMDGCTQISDEHFFELPLMVGKLNVANRSRSTFRAFNAQRIEIINDGSNGEAAIVRATGHDDYYWLLELELMGEGVLNGMPKYLSNPFDLQIVVDYILEPDSPTLQIDYKLINTRNGLNSFNIAFVLMSSGQGPTLNTFSAFDIDIEGLALQHRIPWVSTNDNGNAYVYSARTDVLTTTHIAGVDALLDANQLANTFLGQLLMPAGIEGDSVLQQFYLTVSNGDELHAVKEHSAHAPIVSDLVDTAFDIRVTDSLTGDPIPNAKLTFQTQKQVFLQDWPFETFLITYTDEQGRFQNTVPFFKYLSNQKYRVIVSAPGRADSAPVFIDRADQTHIPVQQLDIALDAQGMLTYEITDDSGNPSPAKISIYQNDQPIDHIYSVSGQGEYPLAPGHYEIMISRGFEYEVLTTEVDVPAFGIAHINERIKHWVNTEGYLSYDAHVHSAPSPDSEVSKDDRIRTAVAAGLEIVVATDHEIMTDLSPNVIAVGAQDYVATIIGQEVTASLPNHTIAFPLDRDPTKIRDFVKWYGLGIGGVFAAEKAAGAQIRTFAHPRGDYLNIIEWDRIAGKPSNLDPRHLGMPADTPLWSWDFEAMEYMNGLQKVFSSGIFEDWMSFINHGHRIIATGASDVHHLKAPGTPRTYFASSTDHAPAFDQDEMVASIKGGDVVVSLGAFARATINQSAGLGDTITDQDGSVDLQLTIEAIPQIDVDHARIYVNCDEVARVKASNPTDSAIKYQGSINIPMPADKDAHVVVLGFGKEALPKVFRQFDPTEVPRFTTNPIYVDTDGNGVWDAPGGKECAI